MLSKIGKFHPHVAYCAYVHGLANKWTYFLRTIPNISDLLQPLKDAIFHHFIPALVGKPVTDLERALFALPVRLGGLGICNPQALADSEFAASVKVTRPLVECILRQQGTYIADIIACRRQAKAEVVALKRDLWSTKASELKSSLPAELQRILSYATETGASSWLTVLPMQEHSFAFHNGAFRDAICLRYGWHPSGLLPICACLKDFTVEHAMNCPTGGFPTIRHNELRDFTASLLSEVCHGVSVEPHLQSLTGEIFSLASAIVEDGARLDVAANGFWGSRHQRVFIDVKVFNPNASSYRGSSLSSLYRRLEKEKRRKYEQRIRVVEMGCFTPLVFSTFGGMSTICKIFFKRLASLLVDKKDVSSSVVMSWLRCRVSFSLLHSAFDCL